MAVKLSGPMDVLYHVAGSRPSTASDLNMAASPHKTEPKTSPKTPIYVGPYMSPNQPGDPNKPNPGNGPRKGPSSDPGIPTWAWALGAGVVLYFLMK